MRGEVLSQAACFFPVYTKVQSQEIVCLHFLLLEYFDCTIPNYTYLAHIFCQALVVHDNGEDYLPP